MESAIAALILITLLLVAALTVAQTLLASQDALLNSWQEMDGRAQERARTDMAVVKADTLSAGTAVEITIKNDGDTKLADFDEWDVVINYYTEWITQPYRIEWLPYSGGVGDDQWTVIGIYSQSAGGIAEVYDPGILNPLEEMIIRARVWPPVGTNSTNLATVTTPNGITASTFFTR